MLVNLTKVANHEYEYNDKILIPPNLYPFSCLWTNWTLDIGHFTKNRNVKIDILIQYTFIYYIYIIYNGS